MSYTLKLSNGKILVTLPDQQTDNASTSLTLIGKNVNSYGIDINQNFINTLENFANSYAPTSPLVGQIWFDTTTQQIKVFTSANQFKLVGVPTIASVQPQTLTVGEFWYDTTTQQLKFKKDNNNIVVIGPEYDATTLKNGWFVEQNGSNTILSLYIRGNVIGFFSDSDFTSPNSLYGITEVLTGFNPVYTSVMMTEWNGTATYARNLLVNGVALDATKFLVDTEPAVQISNPLLINSNTSTSLLSVGNNGEFQFYSGNTSTLFLGSANSDFELAVNPAITPKPLLHFSSSTGKLGIFTSIPETTYNNNNVDITVTGDMLLNGNLYVNGTQTNVIVNDLVVSDKTIVLANSTSPSDSNADLGGIVLKGTTDKTILWDSSSNSWKFNTSIDATNTISINGANVFDNSNTISSSVTSAKGINETGIITTGTFAQLIVEKIGDFESRIGVNPQVSTSATITIGNSYTSSINMSGKQVFNARTPVPTDANYLNSVPNVSFVLNSLDLIRNLRAILTVDVTGKGTSSSDPNINTFVIQMLSIMLDLTQSGINTIPDGTVAKVLCTRSTISGTDIVVNRAIKQYITLNSTWITYNGTGSDNILYTDGTW